MELKKGDKYTFISPRYDKWVICEVLNDETHGYLYTPLKPFSALYYGKTVQNSYLFENDVYMLHNLEGPAFISNMNFVKPSPDGEIYFIHGIRYEYDEFIQYIRENKLKRILNG